MSESKKKIAITTSSFGEYDRKPLSLLEARGYEITLNPYGRKLYKEEVVEFCEDAIGIIAGTEQIDASVIEELKLLKVISRCGTGMDNVDIEAAGRKGIKVFNTPDAPTIAVAELTIGLALTLLRKVHVMDSGIRNNKWQKLMGNLISDKKAGIIGFGRIGKKVAGLLEAFGCKVAYSDTNISRDYPNITCLPLEDLFRWADILFLHVSTKETIIGEKELGLIKDGAWIINVSRGEVIDEKALYEALKSRKLAGAALDVFRAEPYTGPLRELENVLLTPHIGSYAKEARTGMELQAVENLLGAIT